MEVKLSYDVNGGRTEREKTLCIIVKKTQLIFLCICIGYLDVRVIPMMILFLWQRKFGCGELGKMELKILGTQ